MEEICRFTYPNTHSHEWLTRFIVPGIISVEWIVSPITKILVAAKIEVELFYYYPVMIATVMVLRYHCWLGLLITFLSWPFE